MDVVVRELSLKVLGATGPTGSPGPASAALLKVTRTGGPSFWPSWSPAWVKLLSAGPPNSARRAGDGCPTAMTSGPGCAAVSRIRCSARRKRSAARAPCAPVGGNSTRSTGRAVRRRRLGSTPPTGGVRRSSSRARTSSSSSSWRASSWWGLVLSRTAWTAATWSITANSVRPPAATGRPASQARITFADVHQDHSLRGSLRVNDSQPTRSSHPRMLSAGGSLAGSLPSSPRCSACCRSQACSRSSLARAPGQRPGCSLR
ncbi:hypothetical protein ACWY4P_07155 [Streptomyces sp. LZ34]